jgi:F420-non-reducing hydrogenase iron-sulfur subunit
MKALAAGADGVMITGCHPGECHYLEQNYKALRRFQLLRRTLKGFGLEPERLRLVWASAAEGARFASEVTNFVETVRALGPLHWGQGNGSPEAFLPGDSGTPELEEVAA